MADFDTVVVGNGLFGSAAARHLTLMGERVAVIGPDEPMTPAQGHDVFASHYDEGRLTRLIDRNPVWAKLTHRAAAGYPTLEQRSGIKFHHPVGALIVDRRSEGGAIDDPLRRAQEDGVTCDVYEAGDSSWQRLFPYLEFPSSHLVIHEPAPAGYINPRKLIAAQNTVALAHGAVVIRETVVAVGSAGGDLSITTASGTTAACDKLLVAAGAFTNFNNLLPVALPLRLNTEMVVLAQVGSDDLARLENMPTIKYMNDDGALDGIYVVPPVRYPDGTDCLKLGANTPSDQYLDTLAAVQHWFDEGDSESCLPSFEGALKGIWPTINFVSVRSKRCILCQTSTTDPIIDQVDDAIFVATGGNGGGAKGSDAWGELAAGLVHDGRWPEDIPRFPVPSQ